MTLRVGDVAPYSYVMDVTSTEVKADLSTVTSAEIRARRSDGTDLTLSPVEISNQTPTTIRLTYVRQAGDLPEAGTHVFVGWMTSPLGLIKSEPRRRRVLGAFDVSG
jgi:hypothetical protein